MSQALASAGDPDDAMEGRIALTQFKAGDVLTAQDVAELSAGWGRDSQSENANGLAHLLAAEADAPRWADAGVTRLTTSNNFRHARRPSAVHRGLG